MGPLLTWILVAGAAKHAPDWVARGVLALMVPTLLLLLWHATNLASKASPFRKPD